MQTMPDAGRPASRSRHGKESSRLWFGLGFLTLVLLLAPLAHRRMHGDAIYPGVQVAGIDLGALGAPEAADRLRAEGLDPDQPALLRVEELDWPIAAGESGLALDLNATVTAAWQVGRGRGPGPVLEYLAARLGGKRIEAIVRYDEAQALKSLEELADAFDREAVNAHVTLEGTAVRQAPAITGRYLKLPDALSALERSAAAGAWPVNGLELAFGTVEPEVKDLGDTIEVAETLLAEALTLRADGESWTLAPEVLAPMLSTEHQGGRVELIIDQAQFQEWMKPITAVISRTASLPRFHFEIETGLLDLQEPGIEGQQVDLESTARRLLDAGRRGSRLVRIALHRQVPGVADDVTAEALGIRELVAESTSLFQGSAPGRVHNVALAASKFDGLLVPPDHVFSFNEHIGDISEETGYEKTLIILDGATADGVGGGVCQVSTTLFRSAFWAGLPFVERNAHGYRVGYYEQGAPVGFDATIYSPIVDLKFKNDTGAWLLIRTYTNTAARSTTFELYGSKPAREVEMGDIVRGKSVPPPPARVEVDPDLPPGASEVVELARDGLSVSIPRIIRDADGERIDTFHSTYRPTGQVTAIGPPAPGSLAGGGTEGSGGESSSP